MSILTYILIFTFIGSIGSLIGGLILLSKDKFASRISHFLSAFAAGAMLATAFFDLLPEASEEAEHLGSEVNIFFWTFIGFITFFLLERSIHWSHHHQTEEKHISGKSHKSIVPLVILGDSMHNFIDGVIIAATFMVSIPLGIITSFAVAAHEIPQEIGDFGIMLKHGMKRSRILWVNVLSAAVSIFGAVLTYMLGGSIENLLPIFLSLAAGFFIYISSADLIPEIHNEEKRVTALIETLVLLLGVFVVWLAIFLLEGTA